MVGSIYAVSVLVLSVLLNLAAQEHHATIGDKDVFRFPKVLLIALMICTPLPGALGFFIWPTFPPTRGALEAGFLIGIFGSLSLITFAVYVQCLRFAAVVGTDGIVIHDWRGARGARTIRYDQIHRMVVQWPWRGRGYLDLYDAAGNKLYRVDAGIQDFEDLVGLVQGRCNKGTRVREREPDGGDWEEWATEGAKEPS